MNKRPLASQVARLALEHDANIIMLAECVLDPEAVIAELASVGLSGFTYPYSPAQDGDIRVFISLPDSELLAASDDPNNHVTIRRLIFTRAPELLLIVVHSQSKRDWSEDDQFQGAIGLSRRIAEVEQEFGHRRTLLVGDLNMNPFEKGIIGSGG